MGAGGGLNRRRDLWLEARSPIGAGPGQFDGLVGATAVLSHMFADALTPSGIKSLAPRDDREICFDVATAAKPIANYGLLVAGGVVELFALMIGAVFTG